MYRLSHCIHTENVGHSVVRCSVKLKTLHNVETKLSHSSHTENVGHSVVRYSVWLNHYLNVETVSL